MAKKALLRHTENFQFFNSRNRENMLIYAIYGYRERIDYERGLHHETKNSIRECGNKN